MKLKKKLRAIKKLKQEIGEIFPSSKLSYKWKFSIFDEIFILELTHTIINGKRKIFLDKKTIFESKKMGFFSDNFSFKFKIKKIQFKIKENSEYQLFIDGCNFDEILKNEKIRKLRINFLKEKKQKLKFDPEFLNKLVSDQSSNYSDYCNKDFFCVEDIKTPFD